MKPIPFRCSGLAIIVGIILSTLSCKKSGIEESEANTTKPLEKIDQKITEQALPGLTSEGTLKASWYGEEITVLKKKNKYVWMGDIAFDQKTFDSLRLPQHNQRTFTNAFNRQWKFGIVYYEVDNTFSQSEKDIISDAINHWRNNSGLTFVPSNGNSYDYISIVRGTTGSGLFSDYLGKKGGRQEINLEGGSGFILGNVVHEIGHAIGFYHEQSRTDRGNSIVINWNNVIPGYAPQFQTYAQLNLPGDQIGVFDFNSVMLYGSYAFSVNGLPTMTTLTGGNFFGQRLGLSTGDIETSDLMYGPPFAKLVRINKYYDSYSGGQTSSEYSIDDFYVKLYSDKACTLPFTTPVDKVTHLILYERTLTGSYQTNITAVVPAGSNSYLLAEDLTTRESHYDYGNPIVDNEKTFGCLDAFWQPF